MSKVIDNTLVMSQEETYNEIMKFLSENQAPEVDKEFLEKENKKMLEEQIDNIINEELGIANEVVKLSNTIEQEIYSLINKGIRRMVFNVKTKFSDVNVDYAYEEFYDKESLVQWVEQRGYDGYSYQTNTIYLSIYSLNGSFNIYDLNDTIMHECNHYWECKKYGKNQYTDRYGTITRGISNWNPCISKICNILYFCDKHEINSFVNGTYSNAMFKRAKYDTYKEFIADNGVNEIYLILKNSEKIVRGLKAKEDVLFFLAALWLVNCGVLNCKVEDVCDEVIKIAKQAYNYLLIRIGKAYALYVAKMEEYKRQEEEAKIKMFLKRQGISNDTQKNGDV